MVDPKNRDIIELIDSWRLYRYEVASQAGICVATLQNWLRKPLTDKQRARIMAAINELVVRK